MSDNVNNPPHYGGANNVYEAIKVIEAWALDFCLGNAVKYISRAGKKDPTKELEDLEKAAWYIQRRIEQLKDKKTINQIINDILNTKPLVKDHKNTTFIHNDPNPFKTFPYRSVCGQENVSTTFVLPGEPQPFSENETKGALAY